MDWMASRPMPGHANTVSVTTAPPSRLPNWSPVMVTMGMAAFLSVCLATTSVSDTPLARAVRMKSARSASSTAERVSRATEAMAKAPSVTAGRTRWASPPRPEVGRSPALSDTRRMNRMPRKKVGADWPIRATPMAAWSRTVLRRIAERRPMGTATTTARAKAASPSSMVAGRYPTTTWNACSR
jgi:hypothetical protein